MVKAWTQCTPLSTIVLPPAIVSLPAAVLIDMSSQAKGGDIAIFDANTKYLRTLFQYKLK